MLTIGAFIIIFITNPLYRISEKIEEVSSELNIMSNSFDKLIDFEKQPYAVGIGSLSIQQSLGGLQGGFADMSKSLNDTNLEFKSLNKKISNSRLLKF